MRRSDLQSGRYRAIIFKSISVTRPATNSTITDICSYQLLAPAPSDVRDGGEGRIKKNDDDQLGGRTRMGLGRSGDLGFWIFVDLPADYPLRYSCLALWRVGYERLLGIRLGRLDLSVLRCFSWILGAVVTVRGQSRV